LENVLLEALSESAEQCVETAEEFLIEFERSVFKISCSC